MRAVGLLDEAGFAIEIRGRPKARVFPEPVGALQHMSLPSSALGMASIWTSKGSMMPSLESDSTKLDLIPKSENRTTENPTNRPL